MSQTGQQPSARTHHTLPSFPEAADATFSEFWSSDPDLEVLLRSRAPISALLVESPIFGQGSSAWHVAPVLLYKLLAPAYVCACWGPFGDLRLGGDHPINNTLHMLSHTIAGLKTMQHLLYMYIWYSCGQLRDDCRRAARPNDCTVSSTEAVAHHKKMS